MQVVRGYEAVPEALKGAAIAIGNFDGVHRGHQAILRNVQEVAARDGVPAGMMSFEPHPRQFFAQAKGRSYPVRLMPLHKKLRRLRDLGLDAAFLMRFTQQFAALSAEEFIERVLIDALQISHVVTGAHFIFGHNRGGDAALLKRYAEQGAFTYDPAAEIPLEGEEEIISSTRIRKALVDGNMALAAQLLGRPYALTGRVIHGDALGRTLGFPTANIALPALHLPHYGVYAVRFRERPEHGVMQAMEAAPWYGGVANLGMRPTVRQAAFSEAKPLLEVHGFDLPEGEQNLYGKRLEVCFEAFIRPEQRFDGVDALRAQIEKDCVIARDMLG